MKVGAPVRKRETVEPRQTLGEEEVTVGLVLGKTIIDSVLDDVQPLEPVIV